MRKLTAISLLFVCLIMTMPAVSAALISLTYDANGNLISGDGKFRVYNDFNQLVEVYNGTNSTGNLLERYEWDPVQEATGLTAVSTAKTTTTPASATAHAPDSGEIKTQSQ